MAKEENGSLKPVTLKLTPETYELYEKVKEEIDAPTASVFMETVLERFYNPVKSDKEKDGAISRLRDHAAGLEAKIERFEKDYSDYDAQISERDAKILSLEKTAAELNEKIGHMVDAGKMPPHSHVIEFEPLNEKVAQHVAERETKNRKGQNWSIGDLVNFYIHQWFICGNPNGSLDNVPDRIINQLKKELETEQVC